MGMNNLKRWTGLSNCFLVAMPSVRGDHFSRSVTYICDHNEKGAMGIVINNPMNITLGDVFAQLCIACDGDAYGEAVLSGGPVNVQRGFVLHRDAGNWDSTLTVSKDIHLTASKDIITSLAVNQGPADAQFALGYAGWGAGQLEQELKSNIWLTLPAESGIIFDIPIEQRRLAVERALGIDLNLVSSQIGHV